MTAPNERFGIFEWYGKPLAALSAAERRDCARVALRDSDDVPMCPFRSSGTRCAKHGGVCSIRRYQRGVDGVLGPGVGTPVIVCPSRFEQERLPARWLAEIVGFDETEMVAQIGVAGGSRRNAARNLAGFVAATALTGLGQRVLNDTVG